MLTDALGSVRQTAHVADTASRARVEPHNHALGSSSAPYRLQQFHTLHLNQICSNFLLRGVSQQTDKAARLPRLDYLSDTCRFSLYT